MRIAILQDDFPPHHEGGAGVVAHMVAHELHRQGHEVLVVTTVRNERDAGVVTTSDGIIVHSLATSYPLHFRAWVSLWNPTVTGKVRRILADFKPDVVHVHNVHTYLSYKCLKIASDKCDIVAVTFHDAMSVHYTKIPQAHVSKKISAWQQFRVFRTRYNPFRNLVIKHYLHYATKRFAVSEALKQALELNGIRGIEVMHNGIDISAWHLEPIVIDAFKKKYNLTNKKVILFGGRLSADKGGRHAVLALAEVLREVPNAVLLVMGERKGYAERMRMLAEEKGFADRLVFTGWISGESLRAAYHASDVVLVPSMYLDPFPTVVLEAMVCKKTVIGSFFGGAKEAIEDNITGYLIDPTNVEHIAERIVRVCLDPDLAQRMGNKGQERIFREFNLEPIIQSLILRCR